MTMTRIYGSSSKNSDERYTPNYAVYPLIEFIPEGKTIWCPFDTEDSAFVNVLSKKNRVIYSHIWNGQDFYEYSPDEEWDMIISNPPFTKKRLIFERALSFGKPFAMLMTMAWLNDSGWIRAYNKYDAQPQILAFDKRINYIDNSTTSITFSSGYFCRDFLPSDLIIKIITKNSQMQFKF